MIELARAALAVGMALGFLASAEALSARLAGTARPLLRFVGAIAVLLWLPQALFHLLASARLFAPIPAAVALALVTAAALRAGDGSAGLARRLARDRVFVRRVGKLLARSRHRGAVMAFFVCAAPALLRPFLLPPLGWDNLTYHALKAAQWVQYGGIDRMDGTGPWGCYRNTLAGGEVFPAWAMLPLSADTLAPAVEVFQWLALGLALLALARRLGAREPYASTAAGFLLALPTVRLAVGSGYVEIALLLALATGLALALEAWRSGRAGLLVLACAALGVAASTKLPTLAMAGLLVLALLARALRGTGAGRGARTALLGALVFAAVVAPWLLRAAARTGYLFTVPVSIGPLTLGAMPPELAWYMERPGLPAYEPGAELAALAQVFGAPGAPSEALGILALVPLLLSLRGLRPASRAPGAALLLAIVVLVNLLTFYAPGFSIVRLGWSVSSGRFLLPLLAVLTLVSVAGLGPPDRAAETYRRILLAALFFHLLLDSTVGFSAASIRGSLVVLAGLWLLAAAFAKLGRIASVGARLAARAALLVVALVALAALRAPLRQEVLRDDFAIHPVPKYWAAAAAAVDEPGKAHVVAVTSGPYQNVDNWFAYPFLGRALRNEVVNVAISRDGALRRWGPGTANVELLRTADADAWTARVRARRVTEVMSFEPPSPELLFMEARPRDFTRVEGVPGRWGLFRVNGPAIVAGP